MSAVASLELASSELPPDEIGVVLAETQPITDTPTPEQVLNSETEQSVEETEAVVTPEPVYGEVMTSKVPLRDGPGGEFPVVGLLHTGFIVQILETSPDGQWLKIVAPTGEMGYAEADFVEQRPGLIPSTLPPIVVTSPSVSQVEIGSTTGNVQMGTVISATKLRRGPSSNFGPSTRMEVGDTFEIITSNLDGSWYQVRLPDGQEGWIMAYKTQPLEPTAATSPALPTIATVEVASTVSPTPDVTATPEATVIPTEVIIPTATPTIQVSLAEVLSQDSPNRGQALFGIILIIAGVGTFLIAIGLGVMYFTSHRAH